jgi:pyruvyltransferase
MLPHVDLFYWNPRRTLVRGRFAKYTRLPVRVNNFGDLIGPLVVRGVLQRLGLAERRAETSSQLFTVGSVLHYADTGGVVWGTGVNGKVGEASHRFTTLDVRAVRGPLTREFLMNRGIATPEVYGDPALLLPYLMPELRALAEVKTRQVTVVPNLNDLHRYPADGRTLNPRSSLMHCLRTIAVSEMVVGSSLHGIIVAEALGIPARLVESGAEAPFKYLDYYLGTGRAGFEPAGSVAAAIASGGEPLPLAFRPSPLVSAFPADLWGQSTPVDAHFVLGDADPADPVDAAGSSLDGRHL